ncbi:MAG: O-antigen ligase family protein, partial [Candidatus Omnitrophica bacterium]|nr:O-antigen ligase family protein [Candidatus Omnitrophota bacterium]
YHSPKELFDTVAMIMCLVFWFIKTLDASKVDIPHPRFFLLLLVFCLIEGLSVTWARNRGLAIRDYSQTLVFFGAFFICVNMVARPKEAAALAYAAFMAGLLCAAYTLFEYFGYDFIHYPAASFPDWRFRLYSTFGNPDFASNYLALIFPVGAAFYFIKERFFEKALLLLSLGVIYSALLAAFSLGALLALFFSIIFAALLFIVERIKLRTLMCQQWSVPRLGLSALILAGVLAAVTFLFFTSNQVNKSSVLRQASSSIAWRNGVSNRLMTYRAAYRMLKDHPLAGVGIGNFKYRLPEYRGKVLGARNRYIDSNILDRERDKHLHNDLIEVWVETGIFGLGVFLFMLFVIFKNSLFLYYDLFDYRVKLLVLGLICSITAFLLHSILSFPFHIMPNGLLFWVFAGLLFALGLGRHRRAAELNIDQDRKGFFKMAVVIIAILACVWPVRVYLSEVFLKRMIDFDSKGQIKDAYVEATSALFFDPGSNAILYIANCENLAGHYDAAAAAYKKALIGNDEINYHVALAEVYLKDGFFRDSISEYNRALALNPSSIPLRLRLAELYADNMMLGEAETECQFITMTNPKDEKVNQRVRDILKVIFDKRFLATYYDKVQVNK